MSDIIYAEDAPPPSTEYHATIVKCGVPGGAWLLSIYEDRDGTEEHLAFTSLPHARRHLAHTAGRKRISLCKPIADVSMYTFDWTE